MPPAFKRFNEGFWDFYQENTVVSDLLRLEGGYTFPQ